MNKHIELVKKGLDGPNSVTSEELKTNSKYAAARADAAELQENITKEAAIARYEELINGTTERQRYL